MTIGSESERVDIGKAFEGEKFYFTHSGYKLWVSPDISCAEFKLLISKIFAKILYNIVKLQFKVQSLGLGVDFVFPLSEQEQEQEQEQEPSPKYTRMKHPRSLKFDT